MKQPNCIVVGRLQNTIESDYSRIAWSVIEGKEIQQIAEFS